VDEYSIGEAVVSRQLPAVSKILPHNSWSGLLVVGCECFGQALAAFYQLFQLLCYFG
jgi:hypothetical protein